MSSRLIFLQGNKLASRLSPRTPYFRASVLRRGVSDMKSTPPPSIQAKHKTDQIDGLDAVGGGTRKPEKVITIAGAKKDVTTINGIQFRDLTNSRVEWMLAFGVGTVLLGVGSMIFKVFYYDVLQEKRMRVHIQGIFKNLEKVIMAEIDHLEKVIVSKIDHLSNKLDTCSQSKKR